ncbi:hypothetical protein AXG93_2550s1000 [Marchantia polymorpha subsp. ruderalis]|uniref:Carboxypeptidase n=1 Tax=Marchantia polymorpha subsp. ruderalis TaxID=1480154 RepID=A0A176VMW4_MARPO|nr:hypothetical protein AXG93_2550s1000 [Marchantia polymorpha subsp. ruderalis]
MARLSNLMLLLLLVWVVSAFTLLPISRGISVRTAGKWPYDHHDQSERTNAEKTALQQQMADKIDRLPGQPPVGFDQYSGYVTVDAFAGRALFYWLVEAWTDAPNKPLVLWLNGGPGCSSIAYGAAEELGPFLIDPDASTLYLNSYSWNSEANLLFLESPAGVGFSYTNTSSDLNNTGDASTAIDASRFLINWFERFPQYKNRPFYIAGESYAGHYVPQLAHVLHNHPVTKKHSLSHINLKGILLGNAELDNYADSAGQIDYWYHHAMISYETYLGIKKHCKWNHEYYTDDCYNLLGYAQAYEIGNIDLYSLYTPKCLNGSNSRVISRHKRRLKIPNQLEEPAYDPCSENYAEVYFNRPDVQKALHANTTGISYRWTACSSTLFALWQDTPDSVLWILKELIAAKLRVWVYSGDADGVVPVQGTRYSLNSLNLTIKSPWFPWYMPNQQVGGRSVEYEGLTFVTIRGAGHEVPLLHRGPSLVLFRSFLSGQSVPRQKRT